MLVLNGFVIYFAFTRLESALRAGLHGFSCAGLRCNSLEWHVAPLMPKPKAVEYEITPQQLATSARIILSHLVAAIDRAKIRIDVLNMPRTIDANTGGQVLAPQMARRPDQRRTAVNAKHHILAQERLERGS